MSLGDALRILSVEEMRSHIPKGKKMHLRVRMT